MSAVGRQVADKRELFARKRSVMSGVVENMRTCVTVLSFAALATLATTAKAGTMPSFDTPAPIPHVQDVRLADNSQASPYAMNYADDAARTLGVRDGHWQAFDTGGNSAQDPLMPSLNGGVDAGGAMLRLQWR